MDLVKESLKEEVDRWIRFHMNKLREVQQYAIDISNDSISHKDYLNVELTMREYANILIDELNIMNKAPITTHTEEIPTPLSISSTDAVSKTAVYSSHKENLVKETILARPVEHQAPKTQTSFKFDQK